MTLTVEHITWIHTHVRAYIPNNVINKVVYHFNCNAVQLTCSNCIYYSTNRDTCTYNSVYATTVTAYISTRLPEVLI